MKIDLTEAVLDRCRGMKGTEAGEEFGVSQHTIRNWLIGKHAPSIEAAQRILDEMLSNLVLPEHQSIGWEGKQLTLLLPVYRYLNPNTHFSVLWFIHKHHDRIGFDYQIGTEPHHARNLLATRFMRTKSEWALFMDEDQLPPLGPEKKQIYNGRWAARVQEPFCSFDAIVRLLSHQKPLVGGCYFGKGNVGPAQFCEAFHDAAVNHWAHQGPYDELRETKWVATGFLLIHRSVFEAIEKQFPQIVSNDKEKPNGYFTTFDVNYGEDVSFMRRARESGIQPYVDMGCWVGHIGDAPYWGYNTGGAVGNGKAAVF